MALLYGTAYWASIQTPNTKFQPIYTVDVAPDDDADLEDLKSRGFKTKMSPEGTECVVIKRKVTSANGKPNKVPALRDRNNNPIDVQVGNGSKVCVQYSEYFGKNSYGDYQGLDLKGVQVLDLIEYEAADGGEFQDFDPESEF